MNPRHKSTPACPHAAAGPPLPSRATSRRCALALAAVLVAALVGDAPRISAGDATGADTPPPQGDFCYVPPPDGSGPPRPRCWPYPLPAPPGTVAI
jgi:hypothetical protein